MIFRNKGMVGAHTEQMQTVGLHSLKEKAPEYPTKGCPTLEKSKRSKEYVSVWVSTVERT